MSALQIRKKSLFGHLRSVATGSQPRRRGVLPFRILMPAILDFRALPLLLSGHVYILNKGY